MKEFLIYFFGKGETEEFSNFTFAHAAPILVAVAIILLLAKFGEKIRGFKFEKNLRYIIAFSLIISEMAYYWRLIALPEMLKPNPIDHLPITVCGWGAVFCSYMLIGKSQTLFDFSYFWSFSGTIFALLTPTVITYTGPTRFRYYQFWTEHLLIYIALFYMIFVYKMRPTVKSAIKSYIGFVIMAIVAYFTNSILGPGANYLFMAKPEDTPSILDILPSNFVIRIIIMASAITFLYFVAYLPWLIKDIALKKKSQTSKTPEEALA